MFKPILARQFGKPSGMLGRFMVRVLNNVNESINHTAAELMDIQPTDRVLDVGFGGGVMIDLLLKGVTDGLVVGIEISTPMLKWGRRKFKEQIQQGRLEIKMADVCSIPYEDGRFNKVCAVNTIYFWPDLERGLREIYRVLENGGLLAVGIRPKAFLEEVRFTDHGFTAYTEGELQTLLETVGFEQIRFNRREDKDMGAIIALANKA